MTNGRGSNPQVIVSDGTTGCVKEGLEASIGFAEGEIIRQNHSIANPESQIRKSCRPPFSLDGAEQKFSHSHEGNSENLIDNRTRIQPFPFCIGFHQIRENISVEQNELARGCRITSLLSSGFVDFPHKLLDVLVFRNSTPQHSRIFERTDALNSGQVLD